MRNNTYTETLSVDITTAFLNCTTRVNSNMYHGIPSLWIPSRYINVQIYYIRHRGTPAAAVKIEEFNSTWRCSFQRSLQSRLLPSAVVILRITCQVRWNVRLIAIITLRQNGRLLAAIFLNAFSRMKIYDFDSNFTEVCSQGPHWQ